MINSSDILFMYSGGTTNTSPDLSLGGPSSVYSIPFSINNLFDNSDVNIEGNNSIDYKCFYVFNNSNQNIFKNLKICFSNQKDSPVQLHLFVRKNP